jgi:hypothetical protein
VSEELDIRSMSVAEAAKLLKIHPKIVRAHTRRGLPLAGKRIDLIVYGAWLNQALLRSALASQQEEKAKADGA